MISAWAAGGGQSREAATLSGAVRVEIVVVEIVVAEAVGQVDALGFGYSVALPAKLGKDLQIARHLLR